jgi:hypothetical protein
MSFEALLTAIVSQTDSNQYFPLKKKSRDLRLLPKSIPLRNAMISALSQWQG